MFPHDRPPSPFIPPGEERGTKEAASPIETGQPQPQPQPGSCYGPNGVNRGDLTLVCEIARQRPAPVGIKPCGNPDYAAGWTGTDQLLPAGQPAEAEYQGVFFCGRRAARLMLKMFPQSGEPRGAFIVQGSIDLHGGAVTLTPVKWVSQPAGYNWLGLSGRSDDGGKTFSGRATGSSTCTIFTLKWIGEASANR